MIDAYDWADNASRCYDLAVETLREQYLAERLPGETAEQWIERKQSRRCDRVCGTMAMVGGRVSIGHLGRRVSLNTLCISYGHIHGKVSLLLRFGQESLST